MGPFREDEIDGNLCEPPKNQMFACFWRLRYIPCSNQFNSMHEIIRSPRALRSKADPAQTYLEEVEYSSNDALIGVTPGGTINRWNPAAEQLFAYKASKVKGAHLSLLMPSDRTRDLKRILRRAREGERTVRFETVCNAGDGRRVDVALTVSPVLDPAGRASAMLVIARDLTRRRSGSAALERRNRELMTFHKLSDIVLSSRSLQKTYRDIVREIRAATGFPIAAIALYDERRQVMVFHGRQQQHGQPSRGTVEVPIDETISGLVIRRGKPLIENRVDKNPKVRSAFLRGARAQTFVGYPMKAGDKIIGCLNLAHTRSIDITPDTARWIESLANYTAVLTERKRYEDELHRSREQLRELSRHVQEAVEDERIRIAREIHDVLGQELSLLQLELGLIQDRLPRAQKELRTKTKRMSRLIDTSIRSVQRISADLRPTLLDNLGLGAAVEWMAKDFQKRSLISCELCIEPPQIRLDPGRSTALFRILQEALTNVLRHARATMVQVRLVKNRRVAALTVRDNGIGIPPDRLADSKSVGLTGMRERAFPWGGNVEIRSREKKGTEIVATLPLST